MVDKPAWPPPPFETEELNYGPSLGVIVLLIFIGFIAVITILLAI